MLDGRYVITRRVGQGAMGAVYRADSIAISRQFAVKIINFKEGASGIDADQVRSRLHREIEAIGRLRNPHVVPFYEVLELFDHFVGVVMDFVDGVTLEELVYRDGPMKLRRAALVLRQVANGVHEAHEAGMIHRDLKPDNVMVERLPAGDDFAHILDFGIVRMDDGVSMTKGFLGTPLYASPEQAMAGEVDRRSDIYSLGALFFFMLTGRPPFTSDNVYEILQSHVRRPAPSLRDTLEDRYCPPDLNELVDDMLAKSPSRRPQTLSHVIERLDHMIRQGLLDEDSPESLDFLASPTDTATLRAESNRTDPTGLGEGSSSVFESEERDKTGPKAAIFRRGPSRGSIRRLIVEQRNATHHPLDHVYLGNTGAYTLNVQVPSDVRSGACSSEGDMLLVSDSGRLTVVRGSYVATVGELRATSLGINAAHALVGSPDGHVYLITDEGPSSLFEEGDAAITALAVDPTDRVWFAGSESGRLYQCKPQEGKRLWHRVLDGPAIAALAISSRGDFFAIARKHGEIEIWSTGNLKQAYARFSVPGAVVRSMAFSADGHLIAVILDDDTIAVHLVEGGQRVHTLRDERNRLLSLAFKGDQLLGYFQVDGQMYARQLDRQAPMTKNQEPKTKNQNPTTN